ncbi:MAG: methyltransferase type 11 [Euryarchaeota archaeon]|nr:methyltransferase type 11 [Euryarchaeota archaeon]
MLFEEAKFIGNLMHELNPEDVFPLCNLGSSNEELAKIRQPWIDKFIFEPAREKGYKVVNVDIKKHPGVDLVGDVTNPEFMKKLKKIGFKSVICSNLLEHVPNESRSEICNSLIELIPKKGYFFISGPYKFPYHPDPIDTMFRPNIEEMANLFPNTTLIKSSIITSNDHKKPLELLKNIARIFMPFYKPNEWLFFPRQFPWLFKNYKATCIVMQN